MSWFNYIGIYLIIGTILMAILDITFNRVKSMLDDEFKEGYTNLERVYVIIVWPIFLYNLIKEILKVNK
jgi:hypothetical protein